jgi:hypothetical protein
MKLDAPNHPGTQEPEPTNENHLLNLDEPTEPIEQDLLNPLNP